MWNPIFLINVLALGVASLVNICFLAYIILRAKHKTGTTMIIFSSVCTTLFVLAAFIELFLPVPFVSYGVVFFGVMLTMGYWLVALLIPNRPFTGIHAALILIALAIAAISSTPGMVYHSITPNPEGFVDIIFGPYGSIPVAYLAIVTTGTCLTYLHRIIFERDPACRYIFKVLAWSFIIFLIAIMVALFILPYFDINFFTNITLGLSVTVVVGSFSILYTQQLAKKNKADCIL